MKPRIVLWASFFLNAFSFLFTIRPQKAALMLGAFGVVATIGYKLLGREYFSPITEVGLVVFYMFAPVVINGGVLLIHDANLKRSEPNAVKLRELLENIVDLVS